MEELIFLVQESEDGGYTARALGESIFTQGDTVEAVKEAVKDAAYCHYDDGKRRIFRLNIN